MVSQPTGDVTSNDIATPGAQRIEWAAKDMKVLNLIKSRFAVEKPLEGIRIAACLHVTTETANLMLTLAAGGAEVALCASNPLSTQDDVASALVYKYGIPTYAIHGENNETYYNHITLTLDHNPHITMDDGADLVTMIHQKRRDLIPTIKAGTEETTTGVIRLKSLAKQGKLGYPIIAINEADTKHFFDNRYGTGQSTVDGITRATNLLWAGKRVVVCGYGWCSRGIAMRARAMGSHVIVTEVDHIRALEATMEGYEVMPMLEASLSGDIFITATGDINVIDKHHIENMKDGSILANSGHFNVEINLPALESISTNKRTVKPYVEEYTLRDGRLLYLLGEGRLINLAAAEGHPSSVMDMSFANQALSVEYLANLTQNLTNDVHTVPKFIDTQVAELKLESLGISIDKLTEEQKRYLESWEEGT